MRSGVEHQEKLTTAPVVRRIKHYGEKKRQGNVNRQQPQYPFSPERSEPAQITKRDQSNQHVKQSEFRKSDVGAHLKLLQKLGQLCCWVQSFILPANQKVDEAVRRSRISPVDRRGRHRRGRFVKISSQTPAAHQAANQEAFPLPQKTAR